MMKMLQRPSVAGVSVDQCGQKVFPRKALSRTKGDDDCVGRWNVGKSEAGHRRKLDVSDWL